MTLDSGRPWRLPVLPPHAPGLRVGLMGGSFNPAHEGHRLASLIAMRRLGLDRVWWIVTPGNPLKDPGALPGLPERVATARAVSHHPRIDVTSFEAELGTRFSVDAALYLRRRCPGTRFVWIMGADILPELHRWRRWRTFLATMPVAVIDRPGSTLNARRGKAAGLMAATRLPEGAAARLPDCAPPASVFLHGPRSTLSSTALRRTFHA